MEGNQLSVIRTEDAASQHPSACLNPASCDAHTLTGECSSNSFPALKHQSAPRLGKQAIVEPGGCLAVQCQFKRRREAWGSAESRALVPPRALRAEHRCRSFPAIRATHLLTTARAAEPCHARPHAYLQCSRSTAPCLPPPSAPPASCRAGRLQCRRFQTCGIRTQAPPRTTPERGSQLHKFSLPIHAASLHRQRPLPPPPAASPPAEWGRKVGAETRPQGHRCAAAGVAQVHEAHPGVGPSQRGGSQGSGRPRVAPRPSPSPNPGRFSLKINK